MFIVNVRSVHVLTGVVDAGTNAVQTECGFHKVQKWFFTVRMSCQVVPVSSIFVCTFSTCSGTFPKFCPNSFTKSYTIRTNMTNSVFYSTRCIIWEILLWLTPRSARRDHASASYGRSNLTVVTISTLNCLATPEEGRERRRLLPLRTTNFHLCSIQWYQTGPNRTTTSWKCLGKNLEVISWRSSFRTCGDTRYRF
jgi:hypothetical protein